MEISWIIGLLAGLFFILFTIGLAQSSNDFFHELRYLNKEVGCTYGAEHREWIRRRRRLWLSLLPFVKY